VRHFNKVLDTRRSVLPHPFATACLVGLQRSGHNQAGTDGVGDSNAQDSGDRGDCSDAIEPTVPGRVLPRHGGGRHLAVPWWVRPADSGEVRGNELLIVDPTMNLL